jgi:hypothetical protein
MPTAKGSFTAELIALIGPAATHALGSNHSLHIL